MGTTKTLLSASEVARAAFVSKQTLIRAINSGDIQPLGKLAGANGVYIFTEEEAKRYADSRPTR